MKQRLYTPLRLFASGALITLLGVGSAWALTPQSPLQTTSPIRAAHSLMVVAQTQENPGEQDLQKGIEEEKQGVETEQQGIQEEQKGVQEEEQGIQEEEKGMEEEKKP